MNDVDAAGVVVCMEDRSDAVVVGQDAAAGGVGSVFAIESRAPV